MKEIVNFWKLNQEQEDKFESLVVLGILDFQDNETLNTVYFNKKDFKEIKWFFKNIFVDFIIKNFFFESLLLLIMVVRPYLAHIFMEIEISIYIF